MNNKGAKNIVFGLMNQIITIAFGLILPRLFIMSYGSETNGLISSVNQLYVYIALLEAGIGTASLQALYKTIAKGDTTATNSVLSATNYFYKRTGMYYLLAVLIMSFGYPLAIKTEIPYWTVFAVILLNGLGGVINYFFQGKYRILLRAEGKNYVLSNLSTALYICTNIMKIVLIWFGFSIVIIQLSYFVLNLVQMTFIMVYIRRNYKWINLNVTPDTKALSAKNSVFVHQISNLVFSNTDVLVLTVMTGLKTVSVYSLYNSFFNMVKSILFSFLDGIQFALGQAFHADFEKFKKLQDTFEACYMTLTFMLFSIMYVLILPFITLYTDGITDINYVDAFIPLLFTLVFLLQGARGPMQLVAEYAGHFKQTQNQAIIEMIINISVTIVSVFWFGIYGVLFGTIAALLYRANAIVLYVNKHILYRSPAKTYKRWGWCAIVFALILIISSSFPVNAGSYFHLLLIAIPVSMIIVLLYCAGMYLFEREAMLYLAANVRKKFSSRKAFRDTNTSD